ncbi:hypothetical protein GCM10017782_25170 [Deinococcus ficus]|nr:hypothetical protein GCM10017782_25170 [Deinococcus ficus]
MAADAAEGEAADAGAEQGLLDLLDPFGPDDGGDEFHRVSFLLNNLHGTGADMGFRCGHFCILFQSYWAYV